MQIINYQDLKDSCKTKYNFQDRQIVRLNLEHYLKLYGLSYLKNNYISKYLYRDIIIGWYMLLGENEKQEEVWINLKTKNIFKGKVFKT